MFNKFYCNKDGPTGCTGPTGATGPHGPEGTSAVDFVEGPTPPTTGEEGQLWSDNTTSFLYVLVNGTWTKVLT